MEHKAGTKSVKDAEFFMAEWAKRAHLNRHLLSSTELKRPQTADEKRTGRHAPTRNHHDFTTVTSPA